MCAHFELKAKANKISKKFNVKIPDIESYNLSVRGFIKTELSPVIFSENNNIKIIDMSFSLCPTWSNEFPAKWTTYNARMEREHKGKLQKIYDVPTWRESFSKGWTCLVPITGAIESSYFGTHAGDIVKFSRKSEEVFYCAGLYSPWLNKETGELKYTYTLLTDDPYKFFYKTGHDRSVFTIKENAYDKWLNDKKMGVDERFSLLRKNRTTHEWEAETYRKMKPGWDKRAPNKDEILKIKYWEPSALGL